MKPFFALSAIVLCSFVTQPVSSEYDIAAIHSGVEADRCWQAVHSHFSKIKVLTSDGDLEEADYILSESNLTTGKYVVKVTRKAKDLYQIDGKDMFIETRYCHEYATGEEVVLIIESTIGYNKGKIIF